ncbi:low-affinity potassium transport protein [[Candida] jaroonii]|uniref:Low-affinity potassium transport protein n=1 Tax=[Candida] jaroonii TaxID=467808 RepID=A0ACA9Y9T6_9ASCO|nr:low-affinity potassium transport protein [[Candida] jaroonii]
MRGEFGLRLRTFIDRILSIIHPYISILIPNFKIAHYVYILFWAILGAIILFPIRNSPFIDMLFFSSGAATQSGLNTIDVNDLKLYQQIIIYLLPMFTTPIFIHGTLLFIRLYGFERYFDNIKESSKLNNKMRRTMSLANTMTNMSGRSRRDGTQLNTENNQTLGIPMVNIHPPNTNNNPTSTDVGSDEENPASVGSVEHISEPSSSSSTPVDTSNTANNDEERGIRFQLPKRPDPSASDMYRSIELLRNHPNERAIIDDDEDGEVLVIKSPNQIENEDGSPIFTKVQFNQPLRRLNKVTSRFKKNRTMSNGSEESIDSEDEPNQSHLNPHRRRDDEESLYTSISNTLSNSLSRSKTVNYLSWEPTVGRNSNFVHLTDDQKAELGGVEYRAIKLLIKIVWGYYIGFHILALIVNVIWIQYKPQHIEQLHGYGINKSWWGIFTAASQFNDVGFTLTPNSMIDYNQSYYIMIWGAFFIVIGNTGFPVLLRFIIWILLKFAKPLTLYQESLQFLLDHPRRCFTLLFPSGPTWWLLAVLIILNGLDLIFFIILDLNNDYLMNIPTGYRVVCGLYTAVSTRTSGTTVVDISQLHYAVQVGYIIMMYISVLPIAISIRRTNVYEEQSLGVYLKDRDADDDEKSPTHFISNHLRNQLSFDLWFIFLALFLICIAENSKLDKDNVRFTPFTILFEVISAYGTVGLSQGFPNSDTSLSGEFTTISKLIIIALMIRGRHRGLPYNLDRAIMLPNDDMTRRDYLQENHELRRQETLERSMSTGTTSGVSNTARSPTSKGMGGGIGSELFKAISRKGDEIRKRRSTFVMERERSRRASTIARPNSFSGPVGDTNQNNHGEVHLHQPQFGQSVHFQNSRHQERDSLSDLTPNENASIDSDK